MWMTTEDARSDFILAAVMAFFVPQLLQFLILLLSFVNQIAFGLLNSLLAASWFQALILIVSVWAITGLMPLYLARYREQGASAFGLDHEGAAIGPGILLALPIPATFITSRALGPSPTVGGSLVDRTIDASLGTIALLSLDLIALIQNLVLIVLIFVGPLLLVSFLHVRARDGFREVTISLTEALRTFGMGAVAAGFVLGLLNVVAANIGFLQLVFNTLGLAALVLIADRLVEPGVTTSRAAIVAPGVAILIATIVLRGGGLFSANLLADLFNGTMAAGFAIVVSVVLQTRRYAWSVVPMFAAAAIWPARMTVANVFWG